MFESAAGRAALSWCQCPVTSWYLYENLGSFVRKLKKKSYNRESLVFCINSYGPNSLHKSKLNVVPLRIALYILLLFKSYF